MNSKYYELFKTLAIVGAALALGIVGFLIFFG